MKVTVIHYADADGSVQLDEAPAGAQGRRARSTRPDILNRRAGTPAEIVGEAEVEGCPA